MENMIKCKACEGLGLKDEIAACPECEGFGTCRACDGLGEVGVAGEIMGDLKG